MNVYFFLLWNVELNGGGGDVKSINEMQVS